jgi:hypothetical protein
MKSRKSWREKLENPKLPKVVAIPPRMQKRFGTGTILVPHPREVDDFIRTVRKGSVTTISRIREFFGGEAPRRYDLPPDHGNFRAHRGRSSRRRHPRW